MSAIRTFRLLPAAAFVIPMALAHGSETRIGVSAHTGFVDFNGRDENVPYGADVRYRVTDEVDLLARYTHTATSFSEQNVLGGDSTCITPCYQRTDMNVDQFLVGTNYRLSTFGLFTGARLGATHLDKPYFAIGAAFGGEWHVLESITVGIETGYSSTFGKPASMSSINLLALATYWL